MASFLRVLALSALVLAINAQPSCVFNEDTEETACTAGDKDYMLEKGLVSDNNDTRKIVLRSCKLIGTEKDAFTGLYTLKSLDLHDNQLKKLEVGVFDNIRELTHLILSQNQITDLPLGLFDQLPKLELLDLKGNRLSKFEVGIFKEQYRLGFLDLSSNVFLGIDLSPMVFEKFRSVTFMDFSGSDMADTPDDLLRNYRMISFLNLAGCSLYEVPKFATARNLRSMYHLMLINNFIDKLDDPSTFNNLPNLGMLNFAGNPIESIHEDIFKSLKKLNSVVLSGNNLKSIPDTLFTGLNKLTDVDLSKNSIEVIPVNAFRGTILKNLNLNNNRFTYLANNFLLELSNSGASLKMLQFNQNPWQCACLRDILKEAKARGVDYSPQGYDGKHKECVTSKEFTCKRQPEASQFFIDKYYA